MGKFIKRLLIVVVVLVVVVAAAAAYFFHAIGGQSGLEAWVGGQLKKVANGYLNPTLDFSRIHYEGGATVSLSDVKLTADDPANAGKRIDILAVKKITLTLSEIPREGQPFKIQKLVLDEPVLRVVLAKPGEATMVGFSDLLKRGPANAASPAASQPEVPLSSVFEIRYIELNNGKLVYDTRAQGVVPMELDQINTKMNVEPKKDEPGFYSIPDFSMKRDPVFNTQIKGGVNLDTMAVAIDDMTVKLKMSRENDHFLPPQLQDMVKAHEVTGDLAIDLKGNLTLSDWKASALLANLTLANGNVTAGEYKLPIDKLEAHYSMANRQGRVDKFNTNLLGGTLNADASIQFNDTMDTQLNATLSKAKLEETLKNQGKYKGLVDSVVHWNGPLTDPMHKSGGNGVMNVTQGRLGKLPVVGEITDQIKNVMKITGVSNYVGDNDTVNATWTFQGDRLNFSQLDLITESVALNGKGTVTYDQHLDLQFAGGPKEKVTGLLGKQAGGILNTITGSGLLVTKVTGTASAPQVAPAIGLGK